MKKMTNRSGLGVRIEFEIGTIRPLCLSDALSNCKEPLVPTDSHTKALAIHPEGNKLVECTSLYQGRCRTRNLSNIRRESDVRFSRPGLVANDAHSSTVAFVSVGPAVAASGAAVAPRPSLPFIVSGGDSLSQQTQRVLYVASTYVPVSQGPRDALDVPAVSSLSLDPQRLFEFSSQSISSGTYMKLDYRRMPLFRSVSHSVPVQSFPSLFPQIPSESTMLAVSRPMDSLTSPLVSPNTRPSRSRNRSSPSWSGCARRTPTSTVTPKHRWSASGEATATTCCR